ncbi:YMR204C [Saccharomyces arboricola H-6]|uniref:Inheritance of peroxisomes protein 1 n=1 Tax=Saccharomyces arboricola (strain H-6 / AS 2.3317 / CBS 10644) TaxID=1160507 RepID=J8Q3C0_SACAR|nr:YMR204C [Saccharomyces arboricola H-6]
MALAKIETKKNNLKSTTKQERKPQSTFQTLKQSLKLSNSRKQKQSATKPSKDTSKPLKPKNQSISSKKSGVQRKRISTQRSSLFTYSNVQVMNSFVPIHNDFQNSSNRIRRSSQVSANDASEASKGSYNDTQSQDSQNTIRLKPTSLMAKGPIEIYQICTGFDKLKDNVVSVQKLSGDSSHDGHVVNYLSIGRHGDIVHPVLPKLQITRLNGAGFKYFISFYNPERYWEIEFLPLTNQTRSELENTAKAFENIISKICQFSHTNEEDTIGNNESLCDKFAPTLGIESPNVEISDDDELNYLLEEEDEHSCTDTDFSVVSNICSNLSTTLSYPNCSTHAVSISINEAFKNAIRRAAPVLNIPIMGPSLHFKHQNKRYNSYSFIDSPAYQSDRHKRLERRSISGFGDL